MSTTSIALPGAFMRGLSVLWIVLVWVALWGDPSLGTALGGLLIGGLVVAITGRGTTGAGAQVRPIAALRLAGLFLVMLVQSTAAVVRSTLHFRAELHSAFVTVSLPPSAPGVATLVANAVSLTPGTLSLDLVMHGDRSSTLHVHALDAPDAEAVRRDVRRLHDLAAAAFDRPEPAAPDPDRTDPCDPSDRSVA